MLIKTLFYPIHHALRLDAECLLAHLLQKPRAFLYTHPDFELTTDIETQFIALFARRQAGEPLAYLIGHKEFWSLELTVNPGVLIPRPETEHLIEWALENLPNKPLLLADLGVGSGAIAIALAHSRPLWKIDATDFSAAALNVARENAMKFALEKQIRFFEGSWCAALPQKNYDAIFSNPPYIAPGDAHLTALTHEPITALTAKNNGLNDLYDIIETAPDYLTSQGWLVLEHGADQSAPVLRALQQAGFHQTRSFSDYAGRMRWSVGRKS